jgi:hypothetical protein
MGLVDCRFCILLTLESIAVTVGLLSRRECDRVKAGFRFWFVLVSLTS